MPPDRSIWRQRQDVLDYYSKIMQFRGIQNPPGRFQDGIRVRVAAIFGVRWPSPIVAIFHRLKSWDCQIRELGTNVQVVVPENMDMKDKFSLTQAASHLVLYDLYGAVGISPSNI